MLRKIIIKKEEGVSFTFKTSSPLIYFTYPLKVAASIFNLSQS